MGPLLFTFLDGAFRYDCAACGQACCRGKGIAIEAARELVPLLKRAPRIAPLLEPLPGGYVRLPDVTDGCWFLHKDGLCGYEQAYGRAAKFVTCRLFPYNRVFRAGAVRIVDVNSVVCPLQDAHGSGAGVSHEELRRELLAIGEGPLTTNAAELPEGAQRLRWQALEQGILTESERFLPQSDYLDFAAWQEEHTRRHLGAAPRPWEAARQTLAGLLDVWRQLYGVAASDSAAYERAAARRLTLLTPSLRFNSLFRRAAPPYPAAAQQLPRQLLASWFLSVLAAQCSGEALSLRGMTELHQAQAAQRALLAQLGEPAALQVPIAAADMPAPVQEALRVLCKRLGAGGGGALGAHLLAASADLPASSRALLVPLLLRAGPSLQVDC